MKLSDARLVKKRQELHNLFVTMERKTKEEKRAKRHGRVRAKIFGTGKRPRLSVFRSNRYITLQLLDDEKGKSILQMNDKKLSSEKKTKTERAEEIGKKFAQAAKNKNVKEVVFDRGGYAYHGRVKAAAEGCRKEGLKF